MRQPSAARFKSLSNEKDLQKRHQEDVKDVKRLQQVLHRKGKTLAKATALLLAAKKIQAHWGEDGED